MATFSGTNYAKLVAKDPNSYVNGVVNGASLHWIYDTVELSAGAADDVVMLGGTIPAGSYIVPISKVVFDALGSGTTIQVGTEDDPDAYLAATSTASSSSANFPSIGKVAAVSADTQLQLTLTASGTYAGTVEIAICYAKF